jgi:hypothetical protein
MRIFILILGPSLFAGNQCFFAEPLASLGTPVPCETSGQVQEAVHTQFHF